MKMVVAFLVWLFSFHTWKDLFLRWVRWSPPSPPATKETARESEHLPSPNGQQQQESSSELSRFLSSLPKDDCRCTRVHVIGKSEIAIIFFGRREFRLSHGTDLHSNYREFLVAVASSKVEFCNRLTVLIAGEESCQHAEAFGDALHQSNNDLRELEIFCDKGSAIPFAKCVSSVVLGNDSIQYLSLVFRGVEGLSGTEEVTEFMARIASPHNLRILKAIAFYHTIVDGEGAWEHLMKPFKSPHSILKVFGFHPLISDVQLEHISGVLDTSTSLKELTVFPSNHPMKYKNVFTKGYTSLATTLSSNQSLKTLECEISSSVELKALLDPLLPKNNSVQCNTTLTELTLFGSIGGKKGIEILVEMLLTNTSLLKLSFDELDVFEADHPQGIENVLEILEALKINKSLKNIAMQGTAVGGYKVLGAMMDLLLENHCIEYIDLRGTNMEKTGDVEYVYSALSKKKEMKLWDIVKGMANVRPKSGRVFLCGEPYAGKTSLRASMKQWQKCLEMKQVQSTFRWGKRNRPKVSKVSKAFKEKVSPKRTRGIEVDSVLCDGIGIITIWDMAGQTDYHSFHELVMPNLSVDGSCSMFLLMSNPTEKTYPFEARNLQRVKEELEYWLRFIASNTRRSHSYRPHVSIIMTHFDYWKDNFALVACIEDVVKKLKSQFEEVLAFDEDKIVFKVDGTNVSHAGHVFDFMKSHLMDLSGRLPKTISACEEVQLCVAKWNEDKSNPRLLKWDDFCESMCKETKDFNNIDHELAKQRKVFVAMSLNDGGHIIFNEKNGVVITDPHWFCHDIVGEFLYQCADINDKLKMISPNGIMSIDHLKHFILYLIKNQGNVDEKFGDILGMMKKLNICYEQDTRNIMIPSFLKNNHRSLCWSRNDESSNFKYLGRRLACKDRTQTMLTFGFFTRLQVSLFEMLPNNNSQDTYQVFPELIRFISDGIEVILQFNDGDIDILLRSYQSEIQVLVFLEIGIIRHIKCLQKDPTLGCLGVCLVEYILRPGCVEKLVSPKDRNSQYVHMTDLELEVVRSGIDANHGWKSCEGLDIGFNKVSTLLGSLAWKDLLERQSKALQKYCTEVQFLDMEIGDNLFHFQDEKDNKSKRLFWQRPWNLLFGSLDVKLDNIMNVQKEVLSKLDEVKESIQSMEHGIKNMQKELLLEVCSRMDRLLLFSKEMQEAQIPKAAYLCEIGSQKLLTQFVPGLDRIKLHLMCESIYKFHKVANQKGCVVNFGTNDTKRFLWMLACGLKIATILTKIGAHVACGMGSMVPDFSDGCKFVALVLDTPGLLDYQIPKETLESFPTQDSKVSRISLDDTLEEQKWLRDFLEPQCQNQKEFYDKFKLKKVVYKKGSPSSAWICDECRSEQCNELQ